MHNGEDIYREFDQLVGRHRKLIEFLCLRASHGQEIYYADLTQECYIALLNHLSERPPSTSEAHERAWVYWRCRSAITRYHRSIKNLHLHLDQTLADTLEAPSEVTSLTLDDLAACLNDTERRCFLLMAAGLDEEELARELRIKRRSVVQLRHNIKKKLQKHWMP